MNKLALDLSERKFRAPQQSRGRRPRDCWGARNSNSREETPELVLYFTVFRFSFRCFLPVQMCFWTFWKIIWTSAALAHKHCFIYRETVIWIYTTFGKHSATFQLYSNCSTKITKYKEFKFVSEHSESSSHLHCFASQVVVTAAVQELRYSCISLQFKWIASL